MAISTLSPNYVTVDHLVPVDADLLSRSPVLQPSQDDQGWENYQHEKRDHCFPFTRSRSAIAQIDIWPGPVSASWAWPATTGPSNLRRTSASATTTPFDRRFEDTLAAFRACCGRSRIQVGVDSGPEPGEFPHALHGLHRSPLRAASAARFEAICQVFDERLQLSQGRGRPRAFRAPPP